MGPATLILFYYLLERLNLNSLKNVTKGPLIYEQYHAQAK